MLAMSAIRVSVYLLCSYGITNPVTLTLIPVRAVGANEGRMNSEPASAAAYVPDKQRLKDYFVISSDCHVNEPPDVFSARVDARFRERIPSMKVDEKGRKWLIMEGARPSWIREAPRNEQVPLAEFKRRWETDGTRPQLDRTKGAMFQLHGGTGPERYRDMDYDGVDAEIVFPNKGLAAFYSPDPALNVAMCRAWNDWAHETFCASARSFPAALIAPADVGAAVEEAKRAAERGFHAVMLPPLIREKGYNLPEFDPLWGVLNEAGLPVCFHAGTGKDPRGATGNGGAVINYVVHAMNTVVQPLVEVCASGVFDRFPRLRCGTVEAGVGWIPYTLQAMDLGYESFAFWATPKLAHKPSEYFRSHCFATFEVDPVGIELRRYIGADNLLWGNDYPHIEGCWPNSDLVVDSWGKSVLHDERAQMLGLNAARIFNIPVPRAYQNKREVA
jgi:predicted TIM-barrel fold metal-dependent hydrolase